jgi:phospholipase C
MEAGSSLGITNDNDPSSNSQSTAAHLVNSLEAKGISWKAYAEDITGTVCPLTPVNRYAPKHLPFVYFDDVTDSGSAMAARCLTHVRPYSELANDLAQGTAAAYNFIVPNLCNDMHDTCAPLSNSTKQGDSWLSSAVPQIIASQAYQAGGALFIVWDEAEVGDGPIPFIALSPFAKAGYASTVHYDHSSLLRSIETVFGVPFLGASAAASDLGDLFSSFP